MRLMKGSVLCALVFLLAGCATSKEELLPAGNSDMMAIWSGRQADPDSTDSRTVTEAARSTLRRGLTNEEAARRQQANT
ncbi:TPA: TIGR03751 family conjugal transfer lipoprotein, partial [Proteus mirabilis]|nr:TIGR03751 family conjugal transfer lipoprotein [Proteus mirabilis]